MLMTTLLAPTLLETERLFLRELTPESYTQLFQSASDREIKKYLGLASVTEFREAKRRFEDGMTTYYTSFRNFHLLDKTDLRVIGRCDFHTWVPTHKRAEVGYTITSAAHKNKGLMTEALQAVLAYGFGKMDLYRVEALASPKNVPSLQLLKRYNFSKEGLLRNHYMVNGVLEDSLLFALLRPEFEERQAARVQHQAQPDS
ncbi:GNAT family N-acetyltransferase [Pontibacter sp. E15-1]|uniref:GNAT family N-acetyltransferase n=1 Tax=Pontibacter sp. E15-1 TaxID=2919918 RepID=UPI001F4FB0E6|nr:GNAT family protein [Pontibacter sp. E15-1]MCJ8164502.1 GNAT family N-acetyltransferase [Pontibacter sp. E15-1]